MADNKKLLNNLFGSLQDALFLGDPLAEGRFACFMQPGEFVPLDIQETDSSYSMFLQSSIANKVIDTSIVNRFERVGFGGNRELLGSVDEIYEDILIKNSLPRKDLSQSELEEIEQLMIKISDLEKNYTFYKRIYDNTDLSLLIELKKENPRHHVVAQLRTQLNEDLRKWKSFGRKDIYERYYSRLIYLQRANPEMIFTGLSENFNVHKRTDIKGNKYLQTFLSPAISSWSNIQWNEFSRTISESDDYNYSKITSWSGGASGRWGLWSAGGGASGSSRYEHEKTSATSISLKFDYAHIQIIRPWMRESLLQDRFWTWNKGFGGSLISDGGNITANPPIRPIGRMPVLVTTLIVVRNLEISGNFNQSEREFRWEQIKRNASVGWGPFSVSGSYKSTTQEEHIRCSYDGITFKMPHPQIIAKLGKLIGKCPNPDQTLPFDRDDAWFPIDGLNEVSSNLIKWSRHLDELVDKEQYERLNADLAIAEEYSKRIDKIEDEIQSQVVAK